MAVGSKSASVTIFEQCYKDYYQSLINFARARLRESSDFCEDCVQETFMVLYNRLQAGEEFEYPRAFLYKTLDNVIKKQKTKIMTDEINTVSLDDPENSMEIAVHDAVDYEKYIKILEDSLDEDEKKIEQIAIENNLSVGAVTMRLSRLRKKLKNLLDDLIY